MDGWICVMVLPSSTDSDISLPFAFKMCFAAAGFSPVEVNSGAGERSFKLAAT